MIWSIPLAFFLCVAAVLAMRKHWQLALSATLAAGLSLAIMACAAQAHSNAILRAILRLAEAKIAELQRQLDSQDESSDQALDGTAGSRTNAASNAP